jgi:PAS domain S-box-containing protein
MLKQDPAKPSKISNTADAEFLADAAVSLAEMPAGEDIYSFIAHGLSRLAPQAVVFVTSFDPHSSQFTVQKLEAPESSLKILDAIVGRSMVGMCFLLSGAVEKDALLSERMVPVPGGMSQLTFGVLPQPACSAIEKKLGISDIYVIGFARDGALFGSVGVVCCGQAKLSNTSLIERFIRLAALALHRRNAEQELTAYKEKLEKLIRERTDELASTVRQLKEEVARHRAAQKTLEESESRYQAIVDSQNQFISRWLPDTTLTFVNKAYCDLLGKSEKELLGTKWIDMPQDWPKEQTLQYIKELIAKGKPKTLQYRKISGDGRALFQHQIDTPIFDHKGNLVEIQSVGMDISDRHKTEVALAAEKERLALILQAVGDGVIAIRADGTIEFMNRAAEKLTGFLESTTGGKRITELLSILHERTRRPLPELLTNLAPGGQSEGTALLVSHDGTERFVGYSVSRTSGDPGQPVETVLVLRDITERSRMEKELQRSEHLESLGVLAGGLAHDFNNLLSGIFGYVSLARICSDGTSEVHKHLEEAMSVLGRARDLTHQLLTFAKGGAPTKTLASLKDIMQQSTSFVFSGTNVKAQLSIPDDLWTCEVDTGQLSEVFNNLLINAQQAMPEGGTVAVKAENIDETGTIPKVLKPGNFVRLSIKDTGIGIPQHHLDRIFDPFFTTKQKGSGLGLAISYSIVRKHDGHISVQSEVGKGTEFSIWLPALPDVQPITDFDTETLYRGKGRILIMDDEDYIRTSAQNMLRLIGYTCDTAENGRLAVEAYKKALVDKQPYNAVVLDLTVPGSLGGKQTLVELKGIDPKVKAIVSSGYSEDPVIANPEEAGFCGVLKKPYTVYQLSKVLFRVLLGSNNG